jgi:molybdopterin molybdotransferase
MISVEEAVDRIVAAVAPLPTEPSPLAESLGRFLRETVRAPIDLPPFDNSAMDGYAVGSSDLPGASAEHPRKLRLIEKIAAGKPASAPLATGNCIRLFTGSPLPEGANAVAMQEDTHPDPEDPGVIVFTDSVRPWENVRLRGEDVRAGTSLGSPGEQLSARTLALLSAVGIQTVPVARRPKVALLATGSELVEPGQPLPSGMIYESNRTLLAGLIQRTGAIPKPYPLVRDDLATTRARLEEALADHDCVITSGGVSVGEFDFVKLALEQLGGRIEFWRVAMKPGKPFVLARVGGKLVFGLPGNPVSSFVTFLFLVRPALLAMQGAARWELPARRGTLIEPLKNLGDRRHFVRVKVSPAGEVSLAGLQASHALSSLALADGLVDVPPATTLLAGTAVHYHPFD